MPRSTSALCPLGVNIESNKWPESGLKWRDSGMAAYEFISDDDGWSSDGYMASVSAAIRKARLSADSLISQRPRARNSFITFDEDRKGCTDIVALTQQIQQRDLQLYLGYHRYHYHVYQPMHPPAPQF